MKGMQGITAKTKLLGYVVSCCLVLSLSSVFIPVKAFEDLDFF